MRSKQISFFALYLLGMSFVGETCYHPTFRQEQCGNGIVEGNEQCDHGEDNGMYGFCKPDCSELGPSCGNGTIETPEECDDGNENNGDGCDNFCKNSCGNGILELSAGEECDNGSNNADTSVCTHICKINICGDSLILAGVEECDDGNNNGLYGFCNADCSGPSPFCGNGMIDGMEECDDGNQLNADGCETTCTRTLQGVIARGSHNCALFQNGHIRCWGAGELGQLGYGNTNNIGDDELPSSAGDVLIGDTVLQLVAGDPHTCALLNSGQVRCWGYGGYGQLGYGNTNSIGDEPNEMPPPNIDIGGTASQITSAGYHICALLDSGQVRCWGDNSAGQLGYGNTNRIGDNELPSSAGDVLVGDTVLQLSAGSSHTCALLNSGQVRCWGYGGYGQLGYGNTNSIGDEPNEMPPLNIDIGGTASQLTSGDHHICALLNSGQVRCWGENFYGQLGYGNTNRIGDDELPSSAGDVSIGDTVLQITAGNSHTCALLNSGQVRCWGSSGYGQLGYGNTNRIGDDELPSSAGDVSIGDTVLQITAGNSHTCALLNSGQVRCWGRNDNGQLGYGNTENIGDNELPSSIGPVPLF